MPWHQCEVCSGEGPAAPVPAAGEASRSGSCEASERRALLPGVSLGRNPSVWERREGISHRGRIGSPPRTQGKASGMVILCDEGHCGGRWGRRAWLPSCERLYQVE